MYRLSSNEHFGKNQPKETFDSQKNPRCQKATKYTRLRLPDESEAFSQGCSSEIQTYAKLWGPTLFQHLQDQSKFFHWALQSLEDGFALLTYSNLPPGEVAAPLKTKIHNFYSIHQGFRVRIPVFNLQISSKTPSRWLLDHQNSVSRIE